MKKVLRTLDTLAENILEEDQETEIHEQLEVVPGHQQVVVPTVSEVAKPEPAKGIIPEAAVQGTSGSRDHQIQTAGEGVIKVQPVREPVVDAEVSPATTPPVASDLFTSDLDEIIENYVPSRHSSDRTSSSVLRTLRMAKVSVDVANLPDIPDPEPAIENAAANEDDFQRLKKRRNGLSSRITKVITPMRQTWTEQSQWPMATEEDVQLAIVNMESLDSRYTKWKAVAEEVQDQAVNQEDGDAAIEEANRHFDKYQRIYESFVVPLRTNFTIAKEQVERERRAALAAIPLVPPGGGGHLEAGDDGSSSYSGRHSPPPEGGGIDARSVFFGDILKANAETMAKAMETLALANQKTKVELEPLKVWEYSGLDSESYWAWRNYFEDSVVNNTSIAIGDKIRTLRQFIKEKSPADKFLGPNAFLSSSSLELALERMDEKYGKLEPAIQKVYFEIQDFPPLTASNDVKKWFENLETKLNEWAGFSLRKENLVVTPARIEEFLTRKVNSDWLSLHMQKKLNTLHFIKAFVKQEEEIKKATPPRERLNFSEIKKMIKDQVIIDDKLKLAQKGVAKPQPDEKGQKEQKGKPGSKKPGGGPTTYVQAGAEGPDVVLPSGSKGPKGKGKGKKTPEHPKPAASGSAPQTQGQKGQQKVIPKPRVLNEKEAQADALGKANKCLFCFLKKKPHESHRLNNCAVVKDGWEYKDLVAAVKAHYLCWSCLRVGHKSASCKWVSKLCEVEDSTGKKCQESHHKQMHPF